MIDPTALVSSSARIGERTRIWGLSQVREDVEIGEDCTIGRNVYIGAGVHVGRNVKIQNLAQVYEPAVVEDGVFIGPAVVLTNDEFPRAVDPDGRLKDASAWTPVGVTLEEGASIGARAVCVAPVTVGRWAMVGAGATVVHDVPDFGLVVGTPARQIGWVGRAGRPLVESDGSWSCPATGARYVVRDGRLSEQEA
jgi:UDP-2-acetamido-3-amino-2,3-dideoxy-glucuronate N-acetyltransferase